jgi:hypothetical protein
MALHLILLNFLIYEENFLFFFISAAETNIDDAYPYTWECRQKLSIEGGKESYLLYTQHSGSFKGGVSLYCTSLNKTSRDDSNKKDTKLAGMSKQQR